MTKTIFSKIIDGEIPSHKIYEDDKVYAFLDINPITHGHTLVIPKKPVEFVWDLADEDYAALMLTARKIARHLRETLQVSYVGVQVVGVDVPHAHVHLIPFNNVSEYNGTPNSASAPSSDALAKTAQTLLLL